MTYEFIADVTMVYCCRTQG